MTTATLDFTRVRLPKRTLAYVRNVGPYVGDTELFERLFNRVLDQLQSQDLVTPGMEAITVYHDDPENVPLEKQRISVGFTVPEGATPKGDLQTLDLPESDYVVGSFELLPHEYGEAWTSTFAYMGEHGYMPSGGPMYESYRNNPQDHPEGKHTVDVCIAVS